MSYPEISKAIRESDLTTLVRFAREQPKELTKLTPFGPWLHFAAVRSTAEIVKFLIGTGADVNARYDFEKGEISPTGATALRRAASYGRVDIVSLLLENGACLHVENTFCNTLFGAIYSGSSEVVQLIVDAGIDLSVSYPTDTKVNMDAIAYAIERGETSIAKIIAQGLATGDTEKADALLEDAKERVICMNTPG